MYRNNVLLSIIIPLYNKENFILPVLRSITNRDKSVEVIIIEDCSTDNSFKITNKYINDNNLEWKLFRNETNSGVSFTRNVGINKANGKYVMFLDADDEITDFNLLMNAVINMEKYNIHYLLLKRNYYNTKV